MAGPECRAAWTQHVWKGIAMLPDSTVGEIRASMRREHLKDLEASLPIRWLAAVLI